MRPSDGKGTEDDEADADPAGFAPRANAAGDFDEEGCVLVTADGGLGVFGDRRDDRNELLLRYARRQSLRLGLDVGANSKKVWGDVGLVGNLAIGDLNGLGT